MLAGIGITAEVDGIWDIVHKAASDSQFAYLRHLPLLSGSWNLNEYAMGGLVALAMGGPGSLMHPQLGL
eukprot:4420052-Amphidinium_carterae.2